MSTGLLKHTNNNVQFYSLFLHKSSGSFSTRNHTVTAKSTHADRTSSPSFYFYCTEEAIRSAMIPLLTAVG